MQADDYLSLLRGALTTLEIVLPAIALGIPLGLLLALIRWRNRAGLSPLVTAFVSLFRATPSVTLILIYFAAPKSGCRCPRRRRRLRR